MRTSETLSEVVPTVAPARPKTTFAGDVTKLVSGTAFAQLLGILAAPFLTRFYAPEAFGMLALFTSITSIVGVIACMRYEFAILLPESDTEASNLLGVSVSFAVLISLLTVPIIWWGGEPLLHWLNAQELAPYLWLVPAMILISGLFHALNYWNSRTKRFGRLSIARVTQSLATTSVQLGSGFAGFASGGSLISAGMVGQALVTAVLGGQIWRDDGRLLLRSINWQGMMYEIKRHHKLPLYSTWAALLNTASWQLPTFMLAAFFSSTVVGYYALGFRLLQIPMGLIGSAIGQVFFQRAAEAKAQGSLAPLVEDVFRRLVMIGLFPLLMLTIIGHDLYSFVFGVNWAEAGVYTQILSVWAFFWFISSPLSTLMIVLEQQKFELMLNISLFVTRFIALGIGGYLADARIALLLFAVSGVIVYGYLSLHTMASSGVEVRKQAHILLTSVLLFLPFGFVQISVNLISNHVGINILVSCILSGIYFLTVKTRLFGRSKCYERRS